MFIAFGGCMKGGMSVEQARTCAAAAAGTTVGNCNEKEAEKIN